MQLPKEARGEMKSARRKQGDDTVRRRLRDSENLKLNTWKNMLWRQEKLQEEKQQQGLDRQNSRDTSGEGQGPKELVSWRVCGGGARCGGVVFEVLGESVSQYVLCLSSAMYSQHSENVC